MSAAAAAASAPYRHCKRQFVEAAATGPSRAVDLAALDRLDPRVVIRLERLSILVRTDAGDYWLDTVRARELERAATWKGLTLFLALAAGLALLLWLLSMVAPS